MSTKKTQFLKTEEVFQMKKFLKNIILFAIVAVFDFAHHAVSQTGHVQSLLMPSHATFSPEAGLKPSYCGVRRKDRILPESSQPEYVQIPVIVSPVEALKNHMPAPYVEGKSENKLIQHVGAVVPHVSQTYSSDYQNSQRSQDLSSYPSSSYQDQNYVNQDAYGQSPRTPHVGRNDQNAQSSMPSGYESHNPDSAQNSTNTPKLSNDNALQQRFMSHDKAHHGSGVKPLFAKSPALIEHNDQALSNDLAVSGMPSGLLSKLAQGAGALGVYGLKNWIMSKLFKLVSTQKHAVLVQDSIKEVVAENQEKTKEKELGSDNLEVENLEIDTDQFLCKNLKSSCVELAEIDAQQQQDDSQVMSGMMPQPADVQSAGPESGSCHTQAQPVEPTPAYLSPAHSLKISTESSNPQGLWGQGKKMLAAIKPLHVAAAVTKIAPYALMIGLAVRGGGCFNQPVVLADGAVGNGSAVVEDGVVDQVIHKIIENRCLSGVAEKALPGVADFVPTQASALALLKACAAQVALAASRIRCIA